MIINFLFINHPSKMLLSPQNLIFRKILTNRVYQIEKKPKKWKNTLFLFFGFHSKLVREHFGPKKMDPPICPPLGYFCNFNLNFEFLEKNIWDTLKWQKYFFCPNQYLSPAIWIFQLSSKTKKLQPFKVSLSSANMSKSRNFVAPVGPLRGKKNKSYFYILLLWPICTKYLTFSQIGDFACREGGHLIWNDPKRKVKLCVNNSTPPSGIPNGRLTAIIGLFLLRFI